MPFSINKINPFNHSVLSELDETELVFYLDKINNLSLNPSIDDISDIFKDIPLSKSLDLVNLFKNEMLKKNGRDFKVNELVKLYSLLPAKILWYEENNNSFSEEYLNTLKTEILKPKFLLKSNLNESFKTSYGFSIHFKSEYKDKVIQYFPFYKDYIEEIFSDDISIYYINALVLGLDSNVSRHFDTTLRRYSPDTINNPLRVSVLYVDVPEMVGGDFILYGDNDIDDKFFARIKPEKNKLLYFKGSLAHEILGISEVKLSDSQYRISVVCEQYQVDYQTLKKLPNFKTNLPRSSWFKSGV